VLLLDGTGVRAGDPETHNNGVELHLGGWCLLRRSRFAIHAWI